MRRSIGASEGSSMFMMGLCAGSILSMIVSLFLSRAAVESFGGMPFQNWVGYVIAQVGFLVATFTYALVRRFDIPSVMRVRKPRNPWHLALTPLIAIATILVFLPLANAWDAFLDIIHFKGAVAMPSAGANNKILVYFVSIAILAILPAFGEEFLMRGNVFHGLSTRNVWFGILISSLLFSLMHANPLQLVHQFGLGMVLCIVLILTDSIWSCVLIHFFNNFISVTLTLFLPEVNQIYVSLGYFNWLTGAASVLVGIFILVLLLYVMYRTGAGREDFRLVGGSITYDEFVIYAPTARKENPVVAFFKFFGSLFTKRGWQRVTRALSNQNDVQYIGKAQPMLGVWFALGLVGVYWIIAFVTGLL